MAAARPPQSPISPAKPAYNYDMTGEQDVRKTEKGRHYLVNPVV